MMLLSLIILLFVIIILLFVIIILLSFIKLLFVIILLSFSPSGLIKFQDVLGGGLLEGGLNRGRGLIKFFKF